MNESSPRRTPLIERLFAGHHDMLAALRSLRRSPGFVAIAVLSLGLAIGLHTTTYALLDAIRHPFIPYANVDQLFEVAPYGQGPNRQFLQRDMYLAVRKRDDLFAAIVPWTYSTAVIEAGDHLVSGNVISAGARMFDVLGVRPVVGRTFDPRGDVAADADAAVISYQLWQEDYGENRNLDALALSFAGRKYHVVGVMGSSVTFPQDADVWLPMPTALETAADGPKWVHALVRLRAGDTRARVKTQLDALAARFATEYEGERALFDYRIDSLRPVPKSLGDLPAGIAAITFLILLIACLNLANLLLARGLSRRREMAVRLALGAKRFALMRYVLTECAIIVGLGGAWGLLASMWGVSLAQSRLPTRITELGFVAPHLSWRVVAFGFAVTGLTVLAAGLLPAIRASRANVNDAMKDGGGGSTGRTSRLYRWLVIGEVAVALMMTVGATSSLDLLYHAHGVPFEFGNDDRLTTWIAVTNTFCNPKDPTARFADDMVRRAEAVPGIRYATMDVVALSPHSIVTSDQSPQPLEVVIGEGTRIGYHLVSPDYFRANQMPIIAGRDFEQADAATQGVAIVNQQMARRLWPLQSPVGRLIKLGPAKSNAPWIPVVGVVGVKYRSAKDSTIVSLGPDLAVVRPIGCHFGTMIARARGRDPHVAITLYQALHAALPGAIVTDVRSDKADFNAALKWQRLMTLLFVAFATFALVLSSVGIFAMLSFVVGQRTREIAMRRALGADAPEIRRLIANQAVELVLAGTVLGSVAALSLGYVIAGLVFHTAALDPVALAAAEAVIIATSLAACIGPVRQAMRADPVQLLRST